MVFMRLMSVVSPAYIFLMAFNWDDGGGGRFDVLISLILLIIRVRGSEKFSRQTVARVTVQKRYPNEISKSVKAAEAIWTSQPY